MFRLTIMFFCCCLIGCHSGIDNNSTNFKKLQKQLFYEIDHELIYQSCQKLMLLNRKGKLSDNIYFYDDDVAKYNELPKPIRLLQPTYVYVLEMMIYIGFFSENREQLLRCFSNEFGQPTSHYGNAKGWGFRKEPFGMDDISGKESLDYLNERFEHFEMELIPGLDYETYREVATLEELKQSIERLDIFIRESQKWIEELAVKKQRLLYQTDHHELLKVCRQVIKRYNDGVFSTDKIDIFEERFAKDLKHIPEIILNLEPVYVWFDVNQVMVALIGGLDHSGVVAYINNDEAVERNTNIKLIDGLVYYDDGLREAGDDYKEYLNSLQEEAIPYIDWARKQKNLPIPDRTKYRE